MDKKTMLKRLIALHKAAARRNWDEVDEELEALTETIEVACTTPIIRRVKVPIFSTGSTRYYGNSGLSGGCTRPCLTGMA